MKELNCLVVGNAGIDTNVFLSTPEIDFEHEGNFTFNIDTPGQAGCYASKCFANLNMKTAFTGHLGQDMMGDYVRADLLKCGIDVSGVDIDPSGTSRSINIMYPDGSRRNFYDGKSHMQLAPPEKSYDLVTAAEIVHFNIPNWARNLLDIAVESSAIVSVDLQDMETPDDPYRKDFLEKSDIIFFSSTNFDNPAIILNELITRYPDKLFVSGMGSRGCATAYKGSVRFFAPVSLEKPVIDTNGAGDSLATGFLYAFINLGLSLEESQLAGQISARWTCGLKGTSQGLIKAFELHEFLLRAGISGLQKVL